MTNLREAVAWAICDAENGPTDANGCRECQLAFMMGNNTPRKQCSRVYEASADAAIAAVLEAMGEPTHAMERAALESVAVDDEGAFPSMLDMLDFSGENKAHTIIRAALKAAVAAFREEHLPIPPTTAKEPR